MLRKILCRKPKLSVVIIFYNMRREAKRTLYSLTTEYQRNIELEDYEVIAIDSGSTEPLDGAWVESLQSNFRYLRVQPTAPTPCEAMNMGIAVARGEWVSCAIDGARILSPKLLKHTLLAMSAWREAFVYTIGMHIGPKRQTLSISEGYCQDVEDKLLAQTDWKDNGYKLFEISALAGSSQNGYMGNIAESNFFTVNKAILQSIRGYDEAFKSKGGGLVNLDIFNRLMSQPDLQPVMLLGEATFHQFHGGVSTNVPIDKHPIEVFKEEYLALRGKPFESVSREPFYFGQVANTSKRFVCP